MTRAIVEKMQDMCSCGTAVQSFELRGTEETTVDSIRNVNYPPPKGGGLEKALKI